MTIEAKRDPKVVAVPCCVIVGSVCMAFSKVRASVA